MHTRIKPLEDLLLEGDKSELPKGTSIEDKHPNNPLLHMVYSGYVKRFSLSSEGSANIQNIYGKGYIFPLTPVLRVLFDQQLYHGPEEFYYETMRETKIYSTSIAEVKKQAQQNPFIYRDLLLVAGRRLRINIQRFENMGLRNTYKRVAHQLLHFANEFGPQQQKNVSIVVPLTHQDIADVLSVSRETVSREIQQLKSKKLILPKAQTFVVLDKQKLQAEAHS